MVLSFRRISKQAKLPQISRDSRHQLSQPLLNCKSPTKPNCANNFITYCKQYGAAPPDEVTMQKAQALLHSMWSDEQQRLGVPFLHDRHVTLALYGQRANRHSIHIHIGPTGASKSGMTDMYAAALGSDCVRFIEAGNFTRASGGTPETTWGFMHETNQAPILCSNELPGRL
jgi:hypothetical protein